MPMVYIPPLLQPLTGREACVDIAARTVREVIERLEERFPGVWERLCEGDELRPGLSVAVDGNVSSLGIWEPLRENSEVHFLPALGGG